MTSFPVRLLLSALLACSAGNAAHAYVVHISASPRSVFLRVGDGGAATHRNNNGTPGESATVNTVSATVPAAALVDGTGLLAMTTDSSHLTSSYDGRAFCDANQIYVGGFVRGGPANGVLSATVPAALVNESGQTLPFSSISWTAGGNGDGNAAQPVPDGRFIAGGGSQTLAAFPRNTFRESCHRFQLANPGVAAAGTYTGRVVYTLSTP
jgi:hypothetical protein